MAKATSLGINVSAETLDKIIADGGGTLKRHNVQYIDPSGTEVNEFNIEYLPIGLPTSGFYVGEYNVAVIDRPIYDTHSDLANALDESFIPHSYARYPEQYFLGFWRAETGEWYIDISKHFESREAAIYKANVEGEIAIWDIANNREILLKD